MAKYLVNGVFNFDFFASMAALMADRKPEAILKLLESHPHIFVVHHRRPLQCHAAIQYK